MNRLSSREWGKLEEKAGRMKREERKGTIAPLHCQPAGNEIIPHFTLTQFLFTPPAVARPFQMEPVHRLIH